MPDMNKLMEYAIMASVALVIIAIVLPLGLIYLGNAGAQSATIGNQTFTLEQSVDPSIITLLTVIVPIMVIVSIVIFFMPKFGARK